MGIFSSLFGGNKKTEDNKERNFDILKYDGIRAMRIGKLTYALKCFECRRISKCRSFFLCCLQFSYYLRRGMKRFP